MCPTGKALFLRHQICLRPRRGAFLSKCFALSAQSITTEQFAKYLEENLLKSDRRKQNV